MKWSWKITRIAGIDLYMHATFPLLVAWVAFNAWRAERSLPAVLEGVLFLLVLFACVVLHEYGHALMARRYGIRTEDITLLPIGGLARLERMPDKPMQEFWVALAGPAVNVFIAIVLFAGLAITSNVPLLSTLSSMNGTFFERLLMVNVSLVLFNLLPAFPMDGGRIVRALLATRMESVRATRIAARLGKGMAVLLGIYGLFGNPFLLFIAVFIWLGAGQEASQEQTRSAISGIPVSQAMLTDFRSLSPTDPLARAVHLVLDGSQHDFPVVANGAVVGILTRSDLFRALAEQNQNLFVSYVMRRPVRVIDAGEMLEAVPQLMQASGQSLLPVIQDGQLVGLITAENMGEFLLIQNALARGMAQRIDPNQA
jgi:Zn-dependent protease/CBS domain-containing protein